MVQIDAHYTPPRLAQELLKGVNIYPKSVADFASGDGALLSCAQKKWDESVYIANDISSQSTLKLLHKIPDLKTSNFDFITEFEKCREFALDRITEGKGIDLILLNPPFTCKGSKKISCSINEMNFACSVALAFFARCLTMLSAQGECLAILPESCLTSEKDSQAMSAIINLFELELIKEAKETVFKECYVRIIMVKARKRNNTTIPEVTKKIYPNKVKNTYQKSNILPVHYYSLLRGKVPVNSINKLNSLNESYSYIHTTDIINGYIDLSVAKQIKSDKGVFSGPLVVIPRVGRPNPQKVAIVKKGHSLILSDCLFGITFKTDAEAILFHNIIINNWVTLQPLYTGTCARYITINKLVSYLESLNITPASSSSACNNVESLSLQCA